MPLPQLVPLGGRLREIKFVEWWKRVMNNPKYHVSGVPTFVFKSTPITQVPMGDTIQPGAQEVTGNARANIPDVTKERNNGGATEYSRILLQRVPGKQSIRRMASCYRFETDKQ